MNAQEIIAKADRGEGLTEEEIRVYREAVKPVKHTYGKYGTLAKKYLEEENVGKFWAIENLPEYLHGIDRQADELYETMYAKLSQDERYKRTGNFMEDYRRQTEIQSLTAIRRQGYGSARLHTFEYAPSQHSAPSLSYGRLLTHRKAEVAI